MPLLARGAELVGRIGRRLDPRARPVVVSYPKSGRTQLRVMLHAAGVAVRFSHAGAGETRGLALEGLRAGPAYWRRNRVLFILRDPRDTAVSAFFQATRRSRVFHGDFASFLRDPVHGLEKILFYHLLWLEAAGTFKDFMLLEYEALQSDPMRHFGRAAGFLSSRPLDHSALARAVEAGRFGAMRRLEESGEGAALFGIALTPGDPEDPDSYKTRRGVVGGWRGYFAPADVALAESLFQLYRYEDRIAAVRHAARV